MIKLQQTEGLRYVFNTYSQLHNYRRYVDRPCSRIGLAACIVLLSYKKYNIKTAVWRV